MRLDDLKVISMHRISELINSADGVKTGTTFTTYGKFREYNAYQSYNLVFEYGPCDIWKVSTNKEAIEEIVKYIIWDSTVVFSMRRKSVIEWQLITLSNEGIPYIYENKHGVYILR